MMSDGDGVFHYRVYGLNLEAQFACPELIAVSDVTPDVVVSRGSVPDHLENMRAAGWKFQANADHVLIKTDRIADILVSQGKRIVIQPKADASEEEVRALFLGWGIGALLHQRSMLPLHGSVISLGDECVVFCAPSGTGKSSLAARFVKRGYRLLDDNIAAIARVDGACQVYPGYPMLKLPDDVHQKPEYSFGTPGSFLPALGKYALRVCHDRLAHPQPLKKIYILTHGEPTARALAPLNGGAKFHSLMQNVFCAQFLQGMDKLAHQFRAIESLAARTPVLQVRLPDWPTPYNDIADVLESDFSRSSS